MNGIKRKNRLLVEGADDKNLLSNLIYKLRPELFAEKDVAEVKGYKNLYNLDEDFIGLILNDSRVYKSLGIVVDADSDFEARYQSIRDGYDTLYQTKFPIEWPTAFPEEGIVATLPNQMKIGFWVMPSNAEAGVLEDFMLEMIPDHDPRISLCKETVGGLFKKQVLASNNDVNLRAKAEAHTWLAWQDEPGTRMGAGVNKNYYNLQAANVVRFMAWVDRLTAA